MRIFFNLKWVIIVWLWAIVQVYGQLPTVFDAKSQPTAPDYSKNEHWAALPFRNDAADNIPKQETWVSDSLKKVDVFFIHPTIYQKGKTWNADLADTKLNKKVDKGTIRYQASVFNAVARVYAPRYRQAIYESFNRRIPTGNEALDFAYGDVKAAFDFYLKNYNQGRPIIIASHSQGTFHARRLLKEYFDTPKMKERLVCAYIVGFAVYPSRYEALSPCAEATETNCYVTWSTFKEGYLYKAKDGLVGEVCVNPVSWRIDSLSATSSGGVMYRLGRKKKYTTAAKVKHNMLWVKTKMPITRYWNTLHILDYNLFWFDIRKNVSTRVNAYLKQKE